jgi:hypothetical protein
MLYAFGFQRVGVVVGDLYFVDPRPDPGQEGPERGVRLEVRLFERPGLEGTIYAAQPITVGQPIWRADLLESVAGPPGTFDRTHHHPRFRGWEPGRRQFDTELSADPVAWVGSQLADLDGLIKGTYLDPGMVDPEDAEQLREAVPEILDAVRRLLARVHAGELASAPASGQATPLSARNGWL